MNDGAAAQMPKSSGGTPQGQENARPPHAAPSRRRRASGHSRLVNLLRVVLPALAIGLLALMALWPRIAGDVAQVPALEDGSDAPGIERPHMLNPRYFGTDSRNRPFSVRAERATYLDDEEEVVALEAPLARMDLGGERQVRLQAERGLFNRTTEVVELYDGVELRDSQGHEVETSRATIRLRAGTASGDAPVTGRGPFGQVEGIGFEWRSDEGVLTLRGPASMSLKPPEGGEP